MEQAAHATAAMAAAVIVRTSRNRARVLIDLVGQSICRRMKVGMSSPEI